MAKLKSGTRIYGNATIDSLLTAGTVNNVTITTPATSATLTLVQGSTLATSGAFSTTLTATGTTNVTLPTSGTLATTAGTLSSATNSTQSGYFGDIFLYDDSTPSHYLGITNSANLTAARTLNVNVNDADRTISLSGGLTLANNFTTSGNFALTLTTTAATNVTLPTTGTLATTGNLSQFAATTSAQLAGIISDETGSGALVFGTSPTLTTPSVSGSITASGTGGDILTLTSTDATSRSTIKLNTNGNDWELGARGSSATPANSFYVYDSASTAYRTVIDSSGRFLVGTINSRNVGFTSAALAQIETTNNVGLSLVNNVNNVGGCIFSIGKSRGTSTGSTTSVQGGDNIGFISFAGADGTDLETSAALIGVWVDDDIFIAAGSFVNGRKYKIATVGNTDFVTLYGAASNTVGVTFTANTNPGSGTGIAAIEPSANTVPGRLSFYTASHGSSNPTERMRINSLGFVGVGTQNPVAQLHSRTDDDGFATVPLLLQNGSITDGTAVGISFAPNNSETADRSAIIYGVNSSGGIGDGTELAFYTNISGEAPTEKLRITSGGDLHVNSLDGDNVDIKLGVHASNANFSIIRSTRLSDTQSSLSFNINNDGLKEVAQFHYEDGLYLRGVGDGTTAGNAGLITFSDQSGAFLAQIISYKPGATNAADLIFVTKASGPNFQERLRISSVGAIGLSGENYGNVGEVLTSNGSAAAPTWQSGGVDVIEVMLFS